MIIDHSLARDRREIRGPHPRASFHQYRTEPLENIVHRPFAGHRQQAGLHLRRRRRQHPNAPFVLPLLEDANSIQMAIQQVAEAVLEERIDNKRAGLLLFALQTAACNLKNTDFDPKQLREATEQRSPVISDIVELLLREMDRPPDTDAFKKPPVSAPPKETIGSFLQLLKSPNEVLRGSASPR